jgi:uncharacterized membrane protein YfcA
MKAIVVFFESIVFYIIVFLTGVYAGILSDSINSDYVLLGIGVLLVLRLGCLAYGKKIRRDEAGTENVGNK